MAFPSLHGYARTCFGPVLIATLRIADFSATELLEIRTVCKETGPKVEISVQLVVDS